MASLPLPSPGQLILENITLLAGSPVAFHALYGHTLSATTFAKPGQTAVANAALHFLISVVDADVADALFKPCFPILDREQERDFRRVVDARLQILEKTKLLPVGAARKSVVAAAGGDRFQDLLWSLSSLAVQQACLRHPAYATASRLRLISAQVRSDSTLSHQSSLRSAPRSSSARADAPPPRQRRFLGVGMLTAAQQRARNADTMRTRIHAERMALARTSDMGAHGADTWASEAHSLRGKIGDFEAKLRMLKAQLADMGFDENGVDIRAADAAPADATPHVAVQPSETPKALAPPSPGSEMTEELKTSPIESMESGSSVDELPEPTADLTTLLAFSTDTRTLRTDVDRLFDSDSKPSTDSTPLTEPLAPVSATPPSTTSAHTAAPQAVIAPRELALSAHNERHASDIVDMVRAATDELEQATSRMDAICQARTDAVAAQPQPPSPPVAISSAVPSSATLVEPLPRMLEASTAKHKGVVDAARKLAKSATVLSDKSRVEAKKLSASDGRSNTAGEKPATADVDVAVAKPTWVSEVVSNDTSSPKAESKDVVAAAGNSRLAAAKVETAKDLHLASSALQASKLADKKSRRASLTGSVSTSASAASSVSTGSSSRRKKDVARPSSDIVSTSKPKTLTTCSTDDRELLVTPTCAASSASKTSRSVRFAELPPSYSATRTCVVDAEGINSGDGTVLTPEAVSPVEDFRLEEEDVILPNPKNSTPAPASKGDVTKTSGNGRRNEKKEDSSNTRKETTGTVRAEANRRSEARDDGADLHRNSGSSHRPPTLQRKHTPRRIMRRKEALHRAAVAPAPIVPRTADPPALHASSSEDSILPEKPAAVQPALDISDVVSAESSTAPQVENDRLEEARAAIGVSFEVQSNPEVFDDVGLGAIGDLDVGDLAVDKEEPVASTPSAGAGSAIPKRLFLTPESSTTTPPATVPAENQKIATKKPSLLRKTSSNVFSTWKGGKHRNAGTSPKDSRLVAIPSSPTDTNILLSSGDDDELLFSPASKVASGLKSRLSKASISRPPVARPANAKTPGAKASQKGGASSKGAKGDGFFAGQTAQWQQNVRSQNVTEGMKIERSLSLASAETLANRAKAAGKGGAQPSSPTKRSRVQSFRARLAALK